MKVLITGTTGMVGKGVLQECLKHPKIKEIVVINRSSVQIKHPKLKEILHSNFNDLKTLSNQMSGFDACFHCMGVSSIGLNEFEYSKLTYSITKELVTVFYQNNPTSTFCYVSGAGTDSSEKGKIMWARVKGKTENMILHTPFGDSYMFRLGGIIPGKGIQSKTKWVNTLITIATPFFSILKKFPSITTSENVGLAMINSVILKTEKKILENIDVNQLARKTKK